MDYRYIGGTIAAMFGIMPAEARGLDETLYIDYSKAARGISESNL